MKVLDDDGDPVPNAVVNFVVVAGTDRLVNPLALGAYVHRVRERNAFGTSPRSAEIAVMVP